MGNAVELCREWATARRKQKELEAEAKEHGKICSDLLPQILLARKAEGLEGTLKLSNLGKLTFKETLRSKIEDRAALLNWLDAEGLSEIAPRAVPWQRLDSLCRERMEEGLGNPPGTSSQLIDSIALTKS